MAKNTNYFFKLDLLILSVLQDKDMYAYEISKYIQEKTNGRIVPKNGTMYPIITSLLDNGYVSTTTIIVNNKARVYYHIEESGRIYLEGIRNDYEYLIHCIDLIVYGDNHKRN